MSIPRFHLAFPVLDLEQTRTFYTDILGCTTGRESANWIDFDFYGHQIVAHQTETMPDCPTCLVEDKPVPTRHFGVLLNREDWLDLAKNLKDRDIEFLIAPHIRFEDAPGEQATMFIQDPSGNGLEFKSFGADEDIFAKDFK